MDGLAHESTADLQKTTTHPSKEYLLVLGISRMSIIPWLPGRKRMCDEVNMRIVMQIMLGPNLTSLFRSDITGNSPVEPATMAFSFLL